jgi:hypothetical protein
MPLDKGGISKYDLHDFLINHYHSPPKKLYFSAKKFLDKELGGLYRTATWWKRMEGNTMKWSVVDVSGDLPAEAR